MTAWAQEALHRTSRRGCPEEGPQGQNQGPGHGEHLYTQGARAVPLQPLLRQEFDMRLILALKGF